MDQETSQQLLQPLHVLVAQRVVTPCHGDMCVYQPRLFNLGSQWLCSLSSGSLGCGCSGNSPKHCWEPSPGPISGAAGLSSLQPGQKLLILCQPCLPHGHCSDTVSPQVGTQRERGERERALQLSPSFS